VNGAADAYAIYSASRCIDLFGLGQSEMLQDKSSVDFTPIVKNLGFTIYADQKSEPIYVWNNVGDNTTTPDYGGMEQLLRNNTGNDAVTRKNKVWSTWENVVGGYNLQTIRLMLLYGSRQHLPGIKIKITVCH